MADRYAAVKLLKVSKILSSHVHISKYFRIVGYLSEFYGKI